MNNLLRLIGRRLVALPIMVVGVSFLVFFIMSLSPIDPAYSALGERRDPRSSLESTGHSTDSTTPSSSFNTAATCGTCSTATSAPTVSELNHVSDLVAAVTLQLTFWACSSRSCSFPLGVLAAPQYRDRWPRQVIRVISVIEKKMVPPSGSPALLVHSGFVGTLPVSGLCLTEDPGGWTCACLPPSLWRCRRQSDDPRRCFYVDGRTGPRLRAPP